MVPETIDDAYCDNCTLDLTINYYISEEQRLLQKQDLFEATPNRPKASATANDKSNSLATNRFRGADQIPTAASPDQKPTTAKKRRARETRTVIRRLQTLKEAGGIGEILGEDKSKAKKIGLDSVKWVKGRGRSLRMTMIARVRVIVA
jgi:hypothetical protein